LIIHIVNARAINVTITIVPQIIRVIVIGVSMLSPPGLIIPKKILLYISPILCYIISPI
jgi:hypothetical protein